MYTSAIAKEITVRDIDRNYKKLHGNGKKTWVKHSNAKREFPILVYNQYGLS
jgi:hypothetical protein